MLSVYSSYIPVHTECRRITLFPLGLLVVCTNVKPKVLDLTHIISISNI